MQEDKAFRVSAQTILVCGGGGRLGVCVRPRKCIGAPENMRTAHRVFAGRQNVSGENVKNRLRLFDFTSAATRKSSVKVK